MSKAQRLQRDTQMQRVLDAALAAGVAGKTSVAIASEVAMPVRAAAGLLSYLREIGKVGMFGGSSRTNPRIWGPPELTTFHVEQRRLKRMQVLLSQETRRKAAQEARAARAAKAAAAQARRPPPVIETTAARQGFRLPSPSVPRWVFDLGGRS